MDETTVALPRDDGAEGTQAQTQTQSADTVELSGESFYRSQKEVDEAFKKRFARERAKWEQERSEGVSVQPEDDTLPKSPPAQTQGRHDELLSRIREDAGEYPDLDLGAEIRRNPMVSYLLAAGHSVSSVYEFLYPGLAESRRIREAEEHALANIRARNLRPAPISPSGGDSARDVERMSEADIRSIDAQVKKGKRVVL